MACHPSNLVLFNDGFNTLVRPDAFFIFSISLTLPARSPFTYEDISCSSCISSLRKSSLAEGPAFLALATFSAVSFNNFTDSPANACCSTSAWSTIKSR